MSVGQVLPGASLVALVTHLPGLRKLRLPRPCDPSTSVIEAAGVDQDQVAAGLRLCKLKIELSERWDRDEAKTVQEGLRGLMARGSEHQGAPRVAVSLGKFYEPFTPRACASDDDTDEGEEEEEEESSGVVIMSMGCRSIPVVRRRT